MDRNKYKKYALQNRQMIDLILQFRTGNELAFFEIYEKFKNLITYFDRFEDAKNELTLLLIELLKNIDLSGFAKDDSCTIQIYIYRSLKNKYIKLSKENQKKEQHIIKSNTWETKGYYKDKTNITFYDALRLLSQKQKQVIIYRYIYGFSIEEIGKMLNVSRQAVNKVKNRALQILEEYYK